VAVKFLVLTVSSTFKFPDISASLFTVNSPLIIVFPLIVVFSFSPLVTVNEPLIFVSLAVKFPLILVSPRVVVPDVTVKSPPRVVFPVISAPSFAINFPLRVVSPVTVNVPPISAYPVVFNAVPLITVTSPSSPPCSYAHLFIISLTLSSIL